MEKLTITEASNNLAKTLALEKLELSKRNHVICDMSLKLLTDEALKAESLGNKVTDLELLCKTHEETIKKLSTKKK